MTIHVRRFHRLAILQGAIAFALAGAVLALSSSALGGAQAPPPSGNRQADWAQQ